MGRLWIALVCVGWLVWLASACVAVSPPTAVQEGAQEVVKAEPSPGLRPTSTPFPRPTPRIPNRNYYTKRCWPACHLDPAYVHDSTTITTDEFEGGLGPGWTWVNEDPTHWSLEEPGLLRIVTQPADLNRLQEVPNVLVRAAPASHFDVVTEITVDPTVNGQAGVVFIDTQEDEAIFLVRGYCDEAPVCVGSGVYFRTTTPDCQPTGLPVDTGTVTLMLRRSGNSFIGYVLRGEEWVRSVVASRC